MLRVQETGVNEVSRHRSLVHGTIMHGLQYLAPQFNRQATSYYTTTSGIGRLLETLHPRKEPLRVGVIGLGTGTLASYGTPGDLYRFYDINPAVIRDRPARTSRISGKAKRPSRRRSVTRA